MPNHRFDVAARLASRPSALVALAFSVAGCVAHDTKLATTPHNTIGEWKAASVASERSSVSPRADAVRPVSRSFEGIASYYWHGSRVATGARYEPHGLTAAHRSLPFGTKVRVSDPKTGRSVVVVINDRGPFVRGRVLDLSLGAARVLGMEKRGTNRVRAEVL